MIPEPPVRRVRWSSAWRIVPSRYPPIQLFERLGDPSEWEILAEIESLTNPRIREELGEISVVPVDERVSGTGASWVMASFVHLGRPSRWTDGSFGVYSCARRLSTSVRETCHHMGRFLAATAEPPVELGMRVLEGQVDASFHDLRRDRRFAPLLDPDSYALSQPFGRRLAGRGSAGIVYESVRDPNGECLGAFRPRAVGRPRDAGHLVYHWDGRTIDRWFDYRTNAWTMAGATRA